MNDQNEMRTNGFENEDTSKLILKELKKQNLLRIISIVLTAAILVCTLTLMKSVASITPKVNSLVEDSQTMIQDIQKEMPEIKNIASNLNEIAQSVNDNGMDSVYQTLDNINRIDFDSLNQSIQGLHDVTEPLAKLFGAFSR